MIKPFLKKIAENIPLDVYMSITKRDVLGLYYHVVSDENLPHIQHLYSYKSPRMFENDLLYLAKNFNLITYEQLAAHCSGGKRLKPKSVILTFDDGLSECYSHARPLLLKHGIPCVFFIPTDFIGNHRLCFDHEASLCIDRVVSLKTNALSEVMKSINVAFGKDFYNEIELIHWIKSITSHEQSTIHHLCKLLEIDVQWYLDTIHPYMTSAEIKRLIDDGFIIGAHSVNHQEFNSLSDLEIEAEITVSCKAIMALTGKDQSPFAFPFSADGVSRDLLQQLREKNKYLGLFFEGNGILTDRNFIIHRMCGDRPTRTDHDRTNIPKFMARAYVEDLAVRTRRFYDSGSNELL
jgi:peptidoglycan/xylan/chitin deacetylase (PgdA/CDA1 family)